jgi:hypothetical protein
MEPEESNKLIFDIKTGDRGFILLLMTLKDLDIVTSEEINVLLNSDDKRIQLNVESWGVTKSKNRKDWHPNGGFKKDYEYRR